MKKRERRLCFMIILKKNIFFRTYRQSVEEFYNFIFSAKKLFNFKLFVFSDGRLLVHAPPLYVFMNNNNIKYCLLFLVVCVARLVCCGNRRVMVNQKFITIHQNLTQREI